MIPLCLAFTIGSAVFYLSRTPKQYEATAVVRIPIAPSSGKDELAFISALLGGSSGDTATEIEVIKGRVFAERIIKDLKIADKEAVPEPEWRYIVSEFQSNLRVGQKTGTNLIKITAVSDSPHKAKITANTTANTYIEVSKASKQETWLNLASHLEVELEKVKNDLKESRQRFYDSAEKEGVMDAFSSILGGPQYTIPETSQAVIRLKSEIMQMEIQLEELQKGFSDRDQRIISLKNRIMLSKKRLQEEIDEAKERYRKQFGLTNTAAEIVFNQQLFSTLISKKQELMAQYVMQNKSPEMAEEALEPLEPSKPNKNFVLMAGVMMGFFIALVLVLLLEYMDRSLHTAEDIVKFTDLPVIGKIPRLKSAKGLRVQRFKSSKDDPERGMLITYNGVSSPRRDWVKELYKESYRMFQLGVMASTSEKVGSSQQNGGTEQRGLTLLVTSSLPEEGKSVVAANLAISISQTGKKVLLVDADCRHPVQHLLLGLDAPAKLTDVLNGRVSWEEAVKGTLIDNLSVIASGQENQANAEANAEANATAIFNSSRLEDFISLLREKFDVIIFDSPPAMLASESVAIGSKVDGVVIVAKANATERDIILRTKEMIQSSGGNILGIALNFASIDRKDHKYYYRRK